VKQAKHAEWKPSKGGPFPLLHTALDPVPSQREWLHTNGSGAYSMSTLPLMHTRRHHGIFIAALEPPLGRYVIMSHAETTVFTEEDRRTYRLSTHQFPNVAPTLGYRLIESFAIDPIPRWTFRLGQHTLERTLCLARGKNSAVLSYTWFGRTPARLVVRPLMPLRPIESLTTEHGGMMQVVTLRPGAVELRPVPTLPVVHFAHEGVFMGSPDWWRKFEYLDDRTEGFQFQEDMWTPGVFELQLEPQRTYHLAVSLGGALEQRPGDVVAETREFWKARDLGPTRSSAVRVLGVAAEQFCLDAHGQALIAAGYPNHQLHVRDILLAVPGLFLARQQPERAERVLAPLLKEQHAGLLPEIVRLPKARRPKPLPDATLWLFETTRLLLARLGPRDLFLSDRLYPALVRAFVRFTSRRRRFVWRSVEGLLVTSAPNVALSWMDARVEGVPVTPRSGMCVEHQALFARGCDTLATLASFYGHDALAHRASEAAMRTRNSFRSRFWCAETEYPYDVVSEPRDRTDAWADQSIRPNALIALAIDPTLFEDWQADAILSRVRTELLTPNAIRSLAPSDARYVGHFGGSRAEREAAYHQGTSWTHLLGFYARAAQHQWGDEPEGREDLVKLLEHAVDQGPLLGQMPQLADGDAPFRARGAPAQATAVAEVLRALVELGG
jgi:predicted glycogen debranching enzyme